MTKTKANRSTTNTKANRRITKAAISKTVRDEESPRCFPPAPSWGPRRGGGGRTPAMDRSLLASAKFVEAPSGYAASEYLVACPARSVRPPLWKPPLPPAGRPKPGMRVQRCHCRCAMTKSATVSRRSRVWPSCQRTSRSRSAGRHGLGDTCGVHLWAGGTPASAEGSRAVHPAPAMVLAISSPRSGVRG
jgi:hypothetical protein